MGAEFFVRPDNYIDRRMWIEGGYEKPQLQFMLKAAREYGFETFIDVGANFGLYSCILGKSDMIKSCHSFECDPRNLYHLYGHIRMNNLFSKVQVHPIAAGDEKGTMILHLGPENSTGRSSLTHVQSADNDHEVLMDEVDAVVDLKGEKILIKIDVEGFEVNVLKGMKTLLAENQCLIQVEILNSEESQDAQKLLDDTGFKHIHTIGRDFYFTNIKDFKDAS